MKNNSMKPVAIFFALSLCGQSVPNRIAPAAFAGSGLNDMASGGQFLVTSNVTYTITLSSAGTPDRFSWSASDGGSGTSINITGGDCAELPAGTGWQTLSHGVRVCWLAATGHHVADTWRVVATANATFGPEALTQMGAEGIVRSAQAKLRERLSVQDFGAKCDQVTVDDGAINAALLYGAKQGLIVHVTCSSAVRNIVLPITSDARSGIEFDHGVFWFCRNNDGSDCVSGNVTSLSGNPIYLINNMALIGPDPTPLTHSSGNGLKIGNGSAAPWLRIYNFLAYYFRGTANCTVANEVTGCAGIWLSNSENSTISDVQSQFNTIGARLDNEFDANTLNNWLLGQNDAYGGVWYNSTSGVANNFTIQSNDRVGWFESGVNAVYRSAWHIENDNISATPGLVTVQFDCNSTHNDQGNILDGWQVSSTVGHTETFSFTRSGTCANKNEIRGGNLFALPAGSVNVAAADDQVFIDSLTPGQLAGSSGGSIFAPDVNFPHEILLQDGAVSSPAFAFASSPGTGIYREAGKLSFSYGSVRQMYIDNTGNHFATRYNATGTGFTGGYLLPANWPTATWSLYNDAGVLQIGDVAGGGKSTVRITDGSPNILNFNGAYRVSNRPLTVGGSGITTTETGGQTTVNNAGVLSVKAGAGISLSGSKGSVTITNTAGAGTGFSGTKTRTVCATITGGTPSGCSLVTETYINGLLQ